METNNNKQQQQRRQLQEMLDLQHRGNSGVNDVGRGQPARSCAPTGLTGHLRPLLARRDDHGTCRASDSDGRPVSRLVQAIGSNSGCVADQSMLINSVDATAQNRKVCELVQHGQSTVHTGQNGVRPIVKKNQQIDLPNEDHIGPASNTQDEFQQQILTDKQFELNQLYRSQQQEKDRNQLLKAQAQREDIELQLSQARQELELQRRRNAELERDLMQRREANQEMSLRLILEEQLNLDQASHKTVVDRAESGRDLNQQLRSVNGQKQMEGKRRLVMSDRGTEQLGQLMAMKNLEALKQRVDTVTDQPPISDLEGRLVRGERLRERYMAQFSYSDNEFDDASGQSEDAQQYSGLQRNFQRPSSDWLLARQIGDAFKNQSSLMKHLELASVNQSLRTVPNRGGLEGEAERAEMQATGQRLRSRQDFDVRHHQQRDTGDGSRQIQQEKAGHVFDKTQKVHNHGTGPLADTYDRLLSASGQFHRLRSRSSERVYSRSRRSSELLMSSSSSHPFNYQPFKRDSQMDSDSSFHGIRNAMEVDASFTTSEEESGGEDEETILRNKRLMERRKTADKSGSSQPPSDEEGNKQAGQEELSRRNSRRSSIVDDVKKMDKLPRKSIEDKKANTSEHDGSIPRRSVGNEDDLDSDNQERPKRQSEKQLGKPQSIPRRSGGGRDEELDSDDQNGQKRSSEKQDFKPQSIPRRSGGGRDEELDSDDQSKRKRSSERQDFKPQSIPRRSVGNEDEIASDGQSRPPPMKLSEAFRMPVSIPSRPSGKDDEFDSDGQSQTKKQPERHPDRSEDASQSILRRPGGGIDGALDSDDQSISQRQSDKQPSFKSQLIPRPSSGGGSEDELAPAGLSKRKMQPMKLSEIFNSKKSLPRHSLINEDDLDSDDDPARRKRQSDDSLKGLDGFAQSTPKQSLKSVNRLDDEDQGGPNGHPEKQGLKGLPQPVPRRSDRLDYPDSDRRNQALFDQRKSGKTTAETVAGKGADSMPEEWSGRPVPAQFLNHSDDEISNAGENDTSRYGSSGEGKKMLYKLPGQQKRDIPDSDDEDIQQELRRRIRRKQGRRPSKLSIASKLSQNAEAQGDDDENDDNRDSRTLKAGADKNASPDGPNRRGSSGSIKSGAAAAAAVNGGKNADSRFQAAKADADPDAYGQFNERSGKDENSKLPSRDIAGLPVGDDSDVKPGLNAKSLNTSMKLGIAGEQTGLQQQREDEDEPKRLLAAGPRNSWRSKHNKTAPDSYTPDSEHRGHLEDTRDTDSDTRSTMPLPQSGPYALRPDSGSKVQLLARRFFQHQDQQKKHREEADATETGGTSDFGAKKDASKPGAAATSKFRDEKPAAASLQEKKALIKSVSRLPAAEGGAVQVKPEDSLSEEDIEACKSRALRKNEERRRRRENKEAAPIGPAASDSDDDDDVAPVAQQENLGESLRLPRKEPDDNDIAPVTGDAPEKTHRESQGVMALERQRKEEQSVKPRAPKPKEKDESVAPIAQSRPHRRRKRRRSSRLESKVRSVSLPPQTTVIYCCTPCPPVNTCGMRFPVPNCYPSAYCNVACRRC